MGTEVLPVELTREFPKGAGEPPDLAQLASFCRSVTSEARAIWEEMDELRYREHAVEVPAGLENDVVKTPLANANVTRSVATMMDQGLKVSIPHNQDEYEGAGRDDRLETRIRTTLEQLRRQKGQDVDSKFVECVTHYGQGGMKLVYAPQLWRNRPRRASGEEDEAYNKRVEGWIKQQRRLPLNWSWVSPLEATPIWREDRMVAILQESERSGDTIYWQGFNGRPTQEWIDSVSRDEDGTGRSLTVQEYWTEDTVTYGIDGQVVSHQKHKYGRVPYTWAYGISPATRDPKYMGQPILWDMSDIIKGLDRLLTQKNSSIRQWAWPTIMATAGPYSVSQETGQWTHVIELEPGGVLQKLPGEILEFLMAPSLGPNIDQQIAIYMQLLQLVGISDPAMGVGDGQSGYAMSQLIQSTRMKFGPIQQHCEAGFEDLITLLLDIVENVMPHPIYMYPKGERNLVRLAPNDICGQRQVQVKLIPTLPTDRYANSSRVIAEYGSSLLSRRQAMEQLGTDDPQAMEMEIIWDQMKARPPIQQLMEDMAMEGVGIELQRLQGGPGQGQTDEQQAMQVLMAQAQQNPALMQALMAQQMGGPPGAGLERLQAPTPGAGIMAAPGVPAIPTPQGPTPGQMTGIGLNPRPQGIGPGQAPGVRRGPVQE